MLSASGLPVPFSIGVAMLSSLLCLTEVEESKLGLLFNGALIAFLIAGHYGLFGLRFF